MVNNCALNDGLLRSPGKQSWELSLVDSLIGKVPRGGRLILFLLGVLAAGGAYRYSTQGSEPPRAARASARAAIPVAAVTVARQDMPIRFTGLGNVQARLTAGINSQDPEGQYKLQPNAPVTVTPPVSAADGRSAT
jgi:hypothetical protein